MSGGLDSSVAAALLKKAGFEVTGVFMKLVNLPRFKDYNSPTTSSHRRSRWAPDEKRAKKIAKILKTPLLVLDLRKEFKKRIVDYFLNGYKKGVTPNPCVVCNKEIKFGLLLEKALSLEADYIATGHYARLKRGENGVHLLKAKDKNKDQSYFLWMLSQNQLERILFPIGDYPRGEVEKLAKKFKLSFLLNIPKSMEICFIQTTINNFLKRYLKPKPGKIISTEGKVIGKHQGLFFYTTGQRKGIRLPGGPYYVLDKNLNKNILIVAKDEKDLYKKELFAKNFNWISGKEPKLSLKVKAKIRYRHQPATATIIKSLKPKTYHLKFKKPQRAITSGQSVVFYRGGEVVGGGIIG